jgi:NADH:ubiquinone oxidoreductase subunit K
MAMTVYHYIILSAGLFCIGLYGAMTRRNAVGVLMAFELMLNSVNINMIAFARYILPKTQNFFISGQIFAIFIIVIAAAETAVGLALVINIYRNMDKINVDEVDMLKW